MASSPFDLLNAHLNVSHETFERLRLYHALLLKWQVKINLISNDTIADSWNRHFLDSAQLIKFLPKTPFGNAIDMGSGAGFPGMVLAILGVENIHLIESDAKKISFLEEVKRITKTSVAIHHTRIEKSPVTRAQLVLSRACSNLTQLLSYSAPYVSHETICLFHKGKNWSTELEDAKKTLVFDHEIFPSVTDKDGVIVKISNIRGAGE